MMRGKVRGWGILLPGRELAHDLEMGRPFFSPSKAAAERERKACQWGGELVRVDLSLDPEGVETFTVLLT